MAGLLNKLFIPEAVRELKYVCITKGEKAYSSQYSEDRPSGRRLITMVGKFPNWGSSPSKWPNIWRLSMGVANYLLG